jgi:CHAT domain-containing protein
VARDHDQHLNLHELRLFVSSRMSEGAEADLPDADREEFEQHLLRCPKCKELSEQELFLSRLSISQWKNQAPMPKRPCPTEQEWMELAAGLKSPIETHDWLEHATECSGCAKLLKLAAEQFADEITPEEMQTFSALKSADKDWQKSIARRMQALSAKESHPSALKQRPERLSFLLQLGGAVAAAAILVSGALWITAFEPSRTVNRLLSHAYSEQRTIDLRLAGAGYAPVEAFRGAELSRLRRPTSLLEAEVTIAKALSRKPDDPFWLDAQGRADLMDENYSSALSALERAHRFSPENQDITIDLSTAYFLRAEVLKRSEDYGEAEELLGQVLAKNPGNGLALFNRAINSERLLLYEQAILDWRRYLEIDPNSPWSEEARKRLATLEEKIDLQKKRSESPLPGPAEFLASPWQDRASQTKDSDQRIERQFELALVDWIPKAFSNAPAPESESRLARRASHHLAEVLVRDHSDFLLADFLRDLERKPFSRQGLPFLADALKTTQTTDLDHSREAAVNAEELFHKSVNRAGELLARFESSYADQLAHQVTPCLSESNVKNEPLLTLRYPWLQAQFLLESAACTNLNDETARKLAVRALALARLHHFPSLELRATTFLAALYQYMGDTASAWRYSTDGLARYWEGDYHPMRGYSLYAGLDLVAEDKEQWFLDVQLLEEASRLISEDPDLELRAVEQHHLSNAFAMTGDFRAALEALDKARALSLRSADGARKKNFEFETQVSFANVELLRSQPSNAIHRLEPLRGQVRGLSDKDLVFDYFRGLGLAYLAVGDSLRARQDVGEALSLAEESLRMNQDERERLIWCRKADRAYRAMVQLKLSGPPREAFAQWEWFKGASLRDSPLEIVTSPGMNYRLSATNPPPVSLVVPADTLVISYALLPEGVYVWTYGQDGVQQHRLDIRPDKAELLARSFGEHCSRPDSQMTIVIAEGRELYKGLFEPIEPFLVTYKHLIIEPDRGLWLVPFESLLDAHNLYLGDHYAISLSPGLPYLSASTPWHGISQETPILLAGDPQTRGMRPLQDAEAEVRGIAHQFRYPSLLLKDDVSYRRISDQMKGAEIFHFSGHAAASPDGVGLLLGDSAVMDATKIRVSDFSGLRLAVLSACDSANGATGVFDDRDSLARLLVGAGIPEVVASRWMVNSRATAALMQEFYAQLFAGKGVSLALRDASRNLRSREGFAHPFYWAGFTVFGKN